ncbi:hypothetical protein Q1695_002234 [Nippostrongylus brasiliensis]|nr:hypothetical protein Q1695_002234 [Nippostrongylus brasiliensis]
MVLPYLAFAVLTSFGTGFSPNAIEEMYRNLGESLPIDITQTGASVLPSVDGFSNSLKSTQSLYSKSTQFPTSPNMELTIDDLNTIRDHLQATGKLNESKKMSLTWLSDNISVLASLMPQSGSQLDHLLGKEYLFVKDALMALELLSIHGIITPEELAASDDSQVLYQAQPYDRLTFHSLGNVIRNIIRDRPED